MSKVNRIHTGEPALWLIVAFLCGLCLSLPLFVELEPRSAGEYALLLGLGLCALWKLAKGILFAVYVTERGVEYHRFGRFFHLVPWSSIAQVSLMNNAVFPKLSKSHPVIVITPEGCPVFCGGESHHSYIRRHRSVLVLIQPDKRRIRFVEQGWGEITYFYLRRDYFNL